MVGISTRKWRIVTCKETEHAALAHEYGDTQCDIAVRRDDPRQVRVLPKVYKRIDEDSNTVHIVETFSQGV